MLRTKSRLLLACTVVVFVALAAVWTGQGSLSAAAKKPLPEPVWGIQIPFYENLVGMEGGVHVYKNGDPNVRVAVLKSATGPVVHRTTVNLCIYPSTNPPKTWVMFSGVDLLDWTVAEVVGPGGECGFPEPYDCCSLPGCFLNFFNSDHPKPGYEHLLFNFWIQSDLEDLSTFPMNVETWIGCGAFSINIWNSFEPLADDDPEPYQTVVARMIGSDIEGPRGLFITRIGNNTWEFRIDQKRFEFSQAYTWATPSVAKNGKTTYIIDTYEPLSGEGTLSFKLILIKNAS